MSMTNERPSGEATRIAESGPVLTVSRWTPQMDARLLEMRRERMSSAGIIRIIGLEFGEFFSRNAILQHAWYLENRESQLEYKRQWYRGLAGGRSEYIRSWRAANPEKYREQIRRAAAKRKAKRLESTQDTEHGQ